MGNYLMVFVLTSATLAISHQVHINIQDVVGFPERSIVCLHFLRNSGSCSNDSIDCDDKSHCEVLTKENLNYPTLRLPDQTVTNETFFKVFIYRSFILSVCDICSQSDCQYMDSSSYQFNGTNNRNCRPPLFYSYRVTLTDLPVTQPTSVSTSIHTTTLSTSVSHHPSTSTRRTSDQTTGSVVQTTESGDQTTINQTFLTSTDNVIPSNTDTPSGNGALIGGIIGGVVVIMVIIIVIIFCCCWKRICRSSVIQDEGAGPCEKEELGLPGMGASEIITSSAPMQTSSQVGTTMDAKHTNDKLPPFIDGAKLNQINEDNEAPHQPNEAVQGSSQETENRKKKKKKKKGKRQKRMSVPTEAEQETAQANIRTENEIGSKKERRERRKENQLQQDNEAVPHEAKQGSVRENMRTENEIESKEERRKRKRREKQIQKMEMQKHIQNEPDVQFDIRQEQANLLISGEAFSKEERKRRKKEKKRAKKRSHEPSTEDILTGNENTWSASAPMPNINGGIEGNPGAPTPYITNQASIDSYEQHGSQGRVKMRNGKVKRKLHKEPEEGNTPHIDFKELNDFM